MDKSICRVCLDEGKFEISNSYQLRQFDIIDANEDHIYIKIFLLFLQLLNVLMDISTMAQFAVKAAELFSGEPIKTQKLKSLFAIMDLM